jgi:hypothetical protein
VKLARVYFQNFPMTNNDKVGQNAMVELTGEG